MPSFPSHFSSKLSPSSSSPRWSRSRSRQISPAVRRCKGVPGGESASLLLPGAPPAAPLCLLSFACAPSPSTSTSFRNFFILRTNCLHFRQTCATCRIRTASRHPPHSRLSVYCRASSSSHKATVACTHVRWFHMSRTALAEMPYCMARRVESEGSLPSVLTW